VAEYLLISHFKEKSVVEIKTHPMKKAFLFIAAALTLSLSSCKDDDPGSYKVRYLVVGDGIEEIKFNANNINYNVKKNFANGWDTTFTHTNKQKLQLQVKAKSNTAANLEGTIFLNDNIVVRQVDDAKDSAGKFDVKLEYQIQ
jgi:hypothetical protein